jgi:hypothetical protein
VTIKSLDCISLWQPWGSLVAGGFKEYETRSWAAPGKMRGQLVAIHASKRWTRDEQHYTERFIRQYPETASVLRPEDYQNPPLGAVLCVCRLIACYSSDMLRDSVSDRERAFGDWSPGRYVWKLEIMRVFEKPYPAKGMQGIFKWEYEL